MKTVKRSALAVILFFPCTCLAQFVDTFEKKEVADWLYFTGDGSARMNFVPMDGFSRIEIDATHDKHNVWWAIIKRDITEYLDLKLLENPSYELRVEARVRVSAAPRRVNFMVNTQRTTDYLKDLREYDIPDTTNWHTISMTTRDFDAAPGDSVYVQLCATDFGIGKYHVDIDYYKADIVDVNSVAPDIGEPLVYHQPPPEVNTLAHHLNASNDALINPVHENVSFNNWRVREKSGDARILTINENHWAILRWDFNSFSGGRISGPGVLELTTQSLFEGGNYIDTYGEDLGEEFGKIRIIEIFGGDPDWEQENVTYANFMQGYSYEEVFNTQMILDQSVSSEPGGKNYISISRPVLQRLIDGTTLGLLIRPLGALDVSFYDSEDRTKRYSPKLHFGLEKQNTINLAKE